MTEYRWSEKEYLDHLVKRGWDKKQAKAMAKGGQQIPTKQPKKSKYKNEVVRDDKGNKIADSKREGKRLQELRILERQGIISGLILQPRFPFKAMPKRGMIRPLVYDSGRVVTYVADFEYYDQEGERVIEDVKGMRTMPYKIKKALMWAYYGIEVYET